LLDLAILGLLKERSMHGYELKKQLAQRLGFFWTVSFGSLYPTLKKLERHGLVSKTAPTDYASRRKQVYKITESGEQRLIALLEEGPSSSWEDEKFSLRLAFFRYLRPETRIRLLERRQQTLEERLREGERSLSRAKRGPADTYTLSLMRHGMEVTESDIAWLDELISAERSALEHPGTDHAADLPSGDHPDADHPVDEQHPDKAPPSSAAQGPGDPGDPHAKEVSKSSGPAPTT
jgi:DNA-binding PadR family transcriptional regulator